MWADIRRPVVIAHRGDSKHAPENTLASFESAYRQGADAIEFDVKLTADGQVVVIHDPKVDRTTDGRGTVSRMTLVELHSLDAGSWFSDRFRGERIPTLEEVFETVGRRLYMNVELTNYTTPLDALVEKVVGLVCKHALEDRVLFSSFFPRNLKKARTLLPPVARGLLAYSGWMGAWARSSGWRGDVCALHPHLTDVNPGLVDRVHSADKLVNVWTVNEEEDLRRMIGLGVDGIIIDDPAFTCRLLGRNNPIGCS